MRIVSFYCILATLVVGCGPNVDTGRNGNAIEQEQPDSKEPGSKNPSGGPPPAAQSCFTTETKTLPPAFAELCKTVIAPNPLLSKANEYLCGKGVLLATMDQKKCGWNGDDTKLRQYIHEYERVPQSSGKNFEDVHATIIHAPVPAAKLIHFVSLVFGDYAEFQREGFHWLQGTIESTNLNGGTFESGIRYRFLVNRDLLDLGYSGLIRLYKIDDKTWVHINFADKDFKLVTGIEQVAIYHDLGDGSSYMTKFEHKSIESRGLYNRAWSGAVELVDDLMKKSWFNATKGG